MNQPVSPVAGSGLHKRFVEDMTVRGFTSKTRHDYIRIVAGFAAFLRHSPKIFAGSRFISRSLGCMRRR